MKSKILLTLVFIMFSALALTARADYTVPANAITNKPAGDIVFNFGTINITNWGQLANYIDQKIYAPGFNSSNTQSYSFKQEGTINDPWSSELASYLRIDRDKMPDYISSQYYSNTTNLANRNYKIFKVDNTNDHIGFIITASDGTSHNRAEDIKQGLNKVFPKDNASGAFLWHKVGYGALPRRQTITLPHLDLALYVSIIIIPTYQMKRGQTTINQTVGEVLIYDSKNNPASANLFRRKIKIIGALNITTPSCTIGNKSINLGTVSRNEILAGNLNEKSTDLNLTCPSGINHIYARAYDVNDTNNRNAFGRLSLKCTSGAEASGVKIEVKVNNSLAKFGERSFVRPINLTTGKEYTNFLARDPTLLDLGNNAGTKTIKVSGKYIQEGAATITPGCANGKMGIIFNYK